MSAAIPPPIPKGLTATEVSERLKLYGPNELPSAGQRGYFQILIRVLQEPMLLLLLACGAIYFVSGEGREGSLLLGSAVFVIALTLYQEVKSERALSALKDLSSPRALVLRDGEWQRIPGRLVVAGDIFRVSEGDRIPADAVMTSATHLSVDESILTGESFSVLKPEMSRFSFGVNEIPSHEHCLFSGTLAIAGQGTAVVYATGAKTELGRIGRSLKEATDEPTPLQRELGRLVRVFGFLGIGLSIAIALIYGVTRGDWPKGILAGLAAAMSLLPEEFPVIMTVFLALGAWRLSRKNVLTRRVAAIEALGAISALCVDKTGTLTQNRMTVRILWSDGQEFDLASGDQLTRGRFKRLAEIAALACNPTPFDPMERAILEIRPSFGLQVDLDPRSLIFQYPFSSGIPAVTCVWKVPESPNLIVAAKGAPETILDFCDLGKSETRSILEEVHRLASKGMRVLGVAEAKSNDFALPKSQQDFDFRFVGLLALEDPIRPDVPASIKECQEAGIRVIMLTGDYPETAKSIAIQLSLPERVLGGAELAQMSDLELREQVRDISVFARVTPEQKLRIITALKLRGERVAMTGDGVNDAPSLRWADIGVAMGGRGTDVARESADIVLLDDRFTSMVSAIRQGRRIYDNLQKAIFFIMAVHVPIAGLAILPVILGLPLFLMPAHIVFLELIIDPACSLVYEVEEDEAGLMTRSPRPANARLLQFHDTLRAVLQGSAILVLVFALYVRLLRDGVSENEARATAFVSFVLSNLGLILIDRSNTADLLNLLRHPNRAFNWIAGGALFLLMLVLAIPGVRSLFSFESISLRNGILAMIVGILSLVSVALIRRTYRQR